jgi:hypothetical protein
LGVGDGTQQPLRAGRRQTQRRRHRGNALRLAGDAESALQAGRIGVLAQHRQPE